MYVNKFGGNLMFVDILGRAKLKIGINIACSDSTENKINLASLYASEGYDALCMPLIYKYTPECEIAGLKILSSVAYIFGEDCDKGKKISVIGIGMTSDPEIFEDWRHMVRTSLQKAGEAIRQIKRRGGISIVILEDDHTFDCESLSRLCDADLIEASSMSHELFTALSTKDKYPSIILLDTDKPHSSLIVDAADFSSHSIILSLFAGRFFSTEGPELHLSQISPERAIINCSAAKRVAYYTSSTAPSVEILEGDDYIVPEYSIKENDSFIMASIFDSNGNRAFSSTHRILKVM